MTSDVKMWTPAYIAIGSNLRDPIQQVLAGFEALATLPNTQLVLRSKLYRSAPLGPQDQPSFVNAVAGVLTQLDSQSVLTHIKRLESELGRDTPVVRWGPRVIDFDLLVFGVERIQTETLQVPHPGIGERNFVLYPLNDIAPDLNVPGLGPVSQLKAKIARGDLSVLA
jgi:2-amino-4-hydroxy-6-hydroxymethyldihydropteridine diphosphokinase